MYCALIECYESIKDESALVACVLSMITRDTRKAEKGSVNHLRVSFGLKQGAFNRLANTMYTSSYLARKFFTVFLCTGLQYR